MRLDRGYFHVALQNNLKVPIICSSPPTGIVRDSYPSYGSSFSISYSIFLFFRKYLSYIWAENWTRIIVDFTFLRRLNNISILGENKCLINNIECSRPVKIHHMWKLSQLSKDISQMNKVMIMLNRKQTNILLLHYNKVDCRKYLRFSLEIKLNKREKEDQKDNLV